MGPAAAAITTCYVLGISTRGRKGAGIGGIQKKDEKDEGEL